MKVVLDTNVLLDDSGIIDKFDEIIIPSAVLEELDGLKKNPDVRFRAKLASKKIEANKDKIKFIVQDIFDITDFPSGWDNTLRDNKICKIAQIHNATLISNDLNLRVKAGVMGVNAESWNEEDYKLNYDGYIEITMDHEEQAYHYENLKTLDYGLLNNEYLIIRDKDTNDIIDKFKFSNGILKKVKYQDIQSRSLGKIKPRNLQQELLFDMLQDKNITIFTTVGKFGVGKDFCMIAHALSAIESGKYDKLIWLRNTIEVKNSKPIGFLKGDMDNKLIPYAMPLADHLGGKMGLELLIQNGKIELQHLGFIRGRDIKNSIIYCSEAENLTKEHMQLIIGRCGEGSVLYINGDFKQVDDKIFEHNNGLHVLIKSLKGYDNFGFMKLEKTERSKTAELSDMLD